jgi:hypothetical protein
MLESLERQQEADAQAPTLARRREAWAALEPGLAHRYAQAIGTPWAAMMVRRRVTPEMIALDEQTQRRLAYLRSDAPDAIRTRARIRADFQRVRQESEEVRTREKAVLLERLAEAGLPFLPDLFLPSDLPQ